MAVPKLYVDREVIEREACRLLNKPLTSRGAPTHPQSARSNSHLGPQVRRIIHAAWGRREQGQNSLSLFHVRSKRKIKSAEKNYTPGIFLSKSPKLPECTKSNQDLSSPLSLAKLAQKMTEKKKSRGFLYVRTKKSATFIEIKPQRINVV